MKTHRIKINKINYSAEDINTNYQIPFSQIHKRDPFHLCIICPTCGAQLYGEWQHLSLYIKRNKKKFNKCSAELITDIAEDILRVSNLDVCPICSGDISNENKYTTSNFSAPYYYEIRPAFKSNEKILTDSNGYLIGRKIKLPTITTLRCSSINECFEEIEKSIVFNTQNSAKSITNDYLSSHTDLSIANNDLPNPLLNDTLKEYILNLINTEANILSLTKRLEQLYYHKLYNDKAVIFEKNYIFYDLKQKIAVKRDNLNYTKEQLYKIQNNSIAYEIIEYPSKPTQPILKTANFFNKRKINAQNEQILREYHTALEKYNADIQKIDAINFKNKIDAENSKKITIEELENDIKKYTKELSSFENKLKERLITDENIPTIAIGEKFIIDSEIKTIKETIVELIKCKDELYSYNIIFEKYRNIVALSKFYEYLMSGRTETLDGVNGAYNIYESELRLNTIISKLDEIVIKLDEIKENQFMIYNKLRDIDNSLSTLNYTMEKAVSSLDTISKNTSDMNVYLDNISKNTAVIAHNSAVTAYYSKVNAELTNALGFMVALK